MPRFSELLLSFKLADLISQFKRLFVLSLFEFLMRLLYALQTDIPPKPGSVYNLKDVFTAYLSSVLSQERTWH